VVQRSVRPKDDLPFIVLRRSMETCTKATVLAHNNSKINAGIVNVSQNSVNKVANARPNIGVCCMLEDQAAHLLINYCQTFASEVKLPSSSMN
jgi:hypothetical protein